MPFTRAAAIYTVPDLTLGTTNVQGSSDGIRADASIAIFDTTVPTTAAASDAAAVEGTVASKMAMLASALIPSELPWTLVSPRVRSGTV